MARNLVPGEFVKSSTLMTKLVAAGNTDLIEVDGSGQAFFAGKFNNTASVAAALTSLAEDGFAEDVSQRELPSRPCSLIYLIAQTLRAARVVCTPTRAGLYLLAYGVQTASGRDGNGQAGRGGGCICGCISRLTGCLLRCA